jgi:hypothetical protein
MIRGVRDMCFICISPVSAAKEITRKLLENLRKTRNRIFVLMFCANRA